MTAPEFVKSMLALLRRQFLADATEKQFYQEKPTLEMAITHPAAWLKNERGVEPTIGVVRKALMTVIETIKAHGKKVDRFSVYFLHCVQLHMRHHGDDYAQALKAPRPVGSMLGRAMKLMNEQRAAGAPDPGAVLVEVNKTLRRRRRVQKIKSNAEELDLFATGRRMTDEGRSGEVAAVSCVILAISVWVGVGLLAVRDYAHSRRPFVITHDPNISISAAPSTPAAEPVHKPRKRAKKFPKPLQIAPDSSFTPPTGSAPDSKS